MCIVPVLLRLWIIHDWLSQEIYRNILLFGGVEPLWALWYPLNIHNTSKWTFPNLISRSGSSITKSYYGGQLLQTKWHYKRTSAKFIGFRMRFTNDNDFHICEFCIHNMTVHIPTTAITVMALLKNQEKMSAQPICYWYMFSTYGGRFWMCA